MRRTRSTCDARHMHVRTRTHTIDAISSANSRGSIDHLAAGPESTAAIDMCTSAVVTLRLERGRYTDLCRSASSRKYYIKTHYLYLHQCAIILFIAFIINI